MARSVNLAAMDMRVWTVQADQDQIVVSYRKEEAAIIDSIKSDFVCQCSVLDFIATLNEFDLFGELIKFV